jgi:hypothetical protein
VAAVLDDAAGALVHELRHADVVRRGLVEGAGDDLDAGDALAEVGDLLGRSSTSSTMTLMSGSFVTTDLAIALRSVVFPALGGATISPRCPRPIGASRSMTRAERSCAPSRA